MPKAYGHDYRTAITLKKMAGEYNRESREERSRGRGYGLDQLYASAKSTLVKLKTYCPGATYSTLTGWTLGTTEAIVYQREQSEDEDFSQDLDNDIDAKKLVALEDDDGDVEVRVFNLSLLPVVVGIVQVVQDPYGDLYIVGAPQQLVVTTPGITKGSTGTCTVDGTSITFTGHARGAATVNSKLCLAWAAQDNKSIYVGPWECT